MSLERFTRRTSYGSEIIGPITEESYRMPTRVIFGRKSLMGFGRLPQVRESERIILVAGKHFKASKNFIRLKLQLVTKECFFYDGQIKKSDFETIDTLTDFCRSKNPTLVIAVGGGTVLDTAKCAAILGKNYGRVVEYVRDKKREITGKRVSLIAIPTTAGTGSEVTPWATVWDKEKKDKYSLSSPLMFPDLAIVDPSLTDSLASKETAEGGIDALTQAIEAYWSVNHNLISDEFALESARLAMENLEKAVNNPDKNSRDNMAKAALFAGLAFSNTQTTICHSVSYPITAYFNVPHGQAVAITLPSFIEYSFPALSPARKKALLQALSSKNETEAREKTETLMERIGLKTKFSELGIKEKDLDLIVRKGFHPDRAKNAPRVPTPEELKSMLLSIL